MDDAHLRALERRAPDDPTALDEVIAAHRRLGRDLPRSVLLLHPRWRGLLDFVARFHRALKDRDGASSGALDRAEARIGVRLPVALREWYLLVGRRPDVVGGDQDRPVPVDELELSDGGVTLYTENQGVIRWRVRAADLGQDDPPVVGDLEDDVSAAPVWNARLSEFCWQMALHQHALAGRSPHRGHADFPRDVRAELDRLLPRLPLPAWPWTSDGEEAVVHYGDDHAIVEYEIGAPSLIVVARSAPALASVRGRLAPLDPEWD